MRLEHRRELNLGSIGPWALLLLQFVVCDACTEDVQLRHVNNSSITPKHYIESDTKKCSDNYPDVTRTCRADELDVSVRSEAVLPEAGVNTLPYVVLNVSTVVHSDASAVFLRLQCVHAADKADDYCHNHQVQIEKWGRMIWPCRSLNLLEPEVTEVPYRFAYTCFRMFRLSHYAINITLSPQMCSSLFYFTIPEENQVHPKIAKFYDQKNISWAPLVVVDTNPSDGVWIRYTEHQSIRHNDVNVTIYKQTSATSLQFAHTQLVKKPNTGFKWKDVSKGTYHVYVYVNRQDCDFSCEDHVQKSRCTPCAHTHVNFTIPENKYSSEKLDELLIKEATRHLVFSLTGVVILVALVLVSIVIYFRIIRPRRLARLPPQNVELQYRPTVLIIYSDDCNEHSNVVLKLCEALQDYGKACVNLDQLDLIDPKLQPRTWLFRTMADVDFVLFLFSESSPRVLAKEVMQPKRHYPDMFCLAVDVMFSDVHQNNNWNKYIFARMSYSDASSIPPHLTSFPAKRVVLPDEFGKLVDDLHRVAEHTTVDHNADLRKLKLAICSFENFNHLQAGWLNERFVSLENENTALLSADLGFKPPEELPTTEEQIALAGIFGLQVPQEENEDLAPSDSGLSTHPTFDVMGSPDDYDSSSTTS
ncbi:hypothetical protein L596_003012 [Steinernema carpocapsae]|uniref:SEFIR domain-containing protein n=1 Tax=Steinernema carpocapsae TaxID=34508 RepID=A0A4V6I7V8_STECR|nr:hypothetical protein L596_003012 [Steinernema carpocapsae]